MRRLRAFAVAGAFTLILAGCADAALEAQGGGAPTNSNAATDEGSAAENQPSAADVDLATCIHGTWLADNDFFLAAIQEFGDQVKFVDGQVTLQFDSDGTLTTDYREWQIAAVADGMEVQIIRHGTDHGTFSATGATLTLEDTEVGSTLAVSTGGTATKFAPLPAKYSDAPYSCSSTEALINTPDSSLVLSRQ